MWKELNKTQMSILEVERLKWLWPTIFRVRLVGLNADFDLDSRDRHDLIHCMPSLRISGLVEKASYLVRTADGLRTNFRQTDIVKLAFLEHLIEHLCVLFDLIFWVAPRRLE